MRALVFDGKIPRLESAQAVPSAIPGEAVIRVTKAAVSATDLEICQGALPYRGTLGREFVGVVESISGPELPGLIGKRVVGSIVTSCANCDLCRRGLTAHCRNQTVLGLHDRPGCLAERITLPVKNLSVVADSVDDDHAVFAFTLSAAMHAARQVTIAGKPHVTVLGDGPLGLLTAQVLSKLNASVRVVGKHHSKLSLCEKWGVKHRHIDDIGRRADQDVVIECSGGEDALDLAMQLVRPQGKIVLKSLARHGRLRTGDGLMPGSLTPLVLNEVEVIGSFGGSIAEAIAALARGEVDVASLISRRMRLNDGTAILKAAADPDALKVLVSV